MNTLTKAELAKMIDHTLLKATATKLEVEKLCDEARQYGFKSVCVNPVHVRLASSLLQEASTVVCTVIGFPLGADTGAAKAQAARFACADGAKEVDFVVNIGAVKEGDYSLVASEFDLMANAVAPDVVVKVILETCYLTAKEIRRTSELAKLAGLTFVKTSTGFGTDGATLENVAIMRDAVGANVGVKASGGIRDTATALAMIKAGASRLGTSASIAIVEGLDHETN